LSLRADWRRLYAHDGEGVGTDAADTRETSASGEKR
jgi:hypothetical protein